MALQGGEEITPESNRRLGEKLDKISDEAKRSRNDDVDPLARDAQLAQKTSADESLSVPLRHDAFHTVVKRVGRIFSECKDAGTPMPGVSPTIPPQAQ